MEELKHECGVAMIRLLKPPTYYQEKYGMRHYALNKLYLMMEKQHNRGQEGAGIACVNLDAPVGEEYMFRERAEGKDAITRVFNGLSPAPSIVREGREVTICGQLGGSPLPVREGFRGGSVIRERHRHRYEFNNAYKEKYEAKGMKCVGINPAANLVEIVEIPDKRWYIGTQFHPEYSSTVLHPHPLFMSFVKVCAK